MNISIKKGQAQIKAKIALRTKYVEKNRLSIPIKPRLGSLSLYVKELEIHAMLSKESLLIQNQFLKKLLSELQQSNREFLEFYNTAPIGYFTLDGNGSIVNLNQEMLLLVGLDKSALLGTLFIDLLESAYKPIWLTHFHGTFAKIGTKSVSAILVMHTASGEKRYVKIQSILNNSSGFNTLHNVVIDVTENVEEEARINKLAFYDALTGLPNRRMFAERLDQAVNISERTDLYSAVMFLDLDKFKEVNDKFGHAAGDRLLVEVARILSKCTRKIDTISRFGGDEFAVVMNEISESKAISKNEVQLIANKIFNLVSAPMKLSYTDEKGAKKTVRHSCQISIGIVLFKNHDKSAAQLMAMADSEMYRAKKREGGHAISFLHTLVH